MHMPQLSMPWRGKLASHLGERERMSARKLCVTLEGKQHSMSQKVAPMTMVLYIVSEIRIARPTIDCYLVRNTSRLIAVNLVQPGIV